MSDCASNRSAADRILGLRARVAVVSSDLSWAISDTFLSSVRAGNGYVIHQDFAYCYTPWIHVLTYRLRDLLVPVQDVVRSGTVVFRARGGLESGSIGDLASADLAELGNAVAYSLNITTREKHSGIHAASVMVHIYRRDLERARARLAELRTKHLLSSFHTHVLRDELDRAQSECGDLRMPEVRE